MELFLAGCFLVDVFWLGVCGAWFDSGATDLCLAAGLAGLGATVFSDVFR